MPLRCVSWSYIGTVIIIHNHNQSIITMISCIVVNLLLIIIADNVTHHCQSKNLFEIQGYADSIAVVGGLVQTAVFVDFVTARALINLSEVLMRKLNGCAPRAHVSKTVPLTDQDFSVKVDCRHESVADEGESDNMEDKNFRR